MKNPERVFDKKKNKYKFVKPKGGFISKAIREKYDNLRNMPSTNKLFKRAHSLAERAYKDFKSGKFENVPLSGPGSKRFRLEGGGPKRKVPEIRDQLFEWFIDIR